MSALAFFSGNALYSKWPIAQVFMMLHRILSMLLLTALMAHSQPANDKIGVDPASAVPPALNGLLQAMTNSQATNNSRPANDKASIYSTRAVPPLKALLQALNPTANIVEGRSGDATNFTCEWPDVTVRFTIKTNWDGPVECSGMKKWILKFPAGEQNTPAVAALGRKMDASVDCVGSVTTPAYDPAGKASSLVLGLAAKLDGYVFSHESFYDATGAKIIGVADAPLKLKDQK
jgi:hypothetical protein